MSTMRYALAGQAALMGGGLLAWGWSRRRPKRSAGGRAATAHQVVEAAQDVAGAARYGMVCCPCAEGEIRCRLMDLHFHPDDERLRLHMITKPWARKAAQLRSAESATTITFHDPRESGENGYTSLSGRVRELTGEAERRACWKGSWSWFHPGPEGSSIIWEFTPHRCEVVNHRRGVAPAWRPATVRRGDGGWRLEEDAPST